MFIKYKHKEGEKKMILKLSVEINGTKEEVWSVITDIKGSVINIKGIEQIEILEQAESDFTGLKWRETRKMFGQTATEVMWITGSEKNSWYDTRAESHGAIYTTRFELKEKGDVTELTMIFGAEIVSTFTRIMTLLTGWIFIGATKKALREDLDDIKKAVEKN